jgi:hypothetical protein
MKPSETTAKAGAEKPPTAHKRPVNITGKRPLFRQRRVGKYRDRDRLQW